MNEMQNNEQLYTEIDIQQILILLWKHKISIALITFAITIFTIIITVFFVQPVYESNQTIAINMPSTITTKYGDYSPIFTTNNQYINLICSNSVLIKTMKDVNLDTNYLSVDEFAKKIKINSNKDEPNTFYISTRANSKELACDIANNLFENFVDYLDKIIELNCTNYFINDYKTKINNLESNIQLNKLLLSENENLLKTIPMTVSTDNFNNIVSDNTIILESIVNENYVKVESNIIDLKQSIISMQNSIDEYNTLIKELEENAEQIDTENYNSILSSAINVNINLTSEPIQPNSRISPSISFNACLAFLIGLIVSILYILFKDFVLKKN